MVFKILGILRSLFLGFLIVLSAVETFLRLAPPNGEHTWFFGMAANELSGWFVLVNVAGAVLAWSRLRIVLPLFAFGFIHALLPFASIPFAAKDVAQQWTEQFPGAPPPKPSAIGIFFRSFTQVSAPHFAPKEVYPGIVLYAGSDAKPNRLRPVVINIHGGSWMSGSYLEDGMFCSALANKGYAVFSIAYRLAPANRFPAHLEDVTAAVRWIQGHASEFAGDGSRIGLVGHSAGGHLAMLATVSPNGLAEGTVKAVVNMYGPSDMRALYKDKPTPDPIDRQAKVAAFLGGAPEEKPDAYAEASPINYFRAALPPMLQLQGGKDRIALPRLTEETHKRLLSAGARSVLVQMPWADHNFDLVYFGPGNQLALNYIEAFLANTLGE